MRAIQFSPDRRDLSSHLSARRAAGKLALADRHAVVVHAAGDGTGEDVPIVLGRRAQPG